MLLRVINLGLSYHSTVFRLPSASYLLSWKLSLPTARIAPRIAHRGACSVENLHSLLADFQPFEGSHPTTDMLVERQLTLASTHLLVLGPDWGTPNLQYHCE
jgi:hypothetical protein